MIQGVLTNLRAIELEDATFVYEWWNDPAVMIGWGQPVAVISRTVTAERIAEWIDLERKNLRPVAFIIERALDRAPIGLLIAPPVDRERRIVRASLLIGDPAEWGLGFGSDAFEAFLDAAFNGWNIHRVELEVEEGNERAERLYRAAGFRVEAVQRGHRFRDGERADLVIMALTAPEWRADRVQDVEATRAQDPNELFDVVRADGSPTGRSKPRWQVHRDGDWHRSIHVWICGIENGVGYIDFQRRGADKDTWPGALDATVGGHLGAGESVANAYREIEEEAGISIAPEQLVHLGTRRGVNERGPFQRDYELQEIHLVRRDGPLDDYQPNVDEVDAFVRVGIDDVIDLLTGERDSIPAHRTESTDSDDPIGSVELSDFIPTADRYFLRVAVAARRFLAGESPIVV